MAQSYDNEEDVEARSNPPITFINRGEKIIMSFLKAFFSQEKLFGHLKNEFYYSDNENESDLVIRMSEDEEINRINASPAITYQEGGFSERREFTGNKKSAKIGQGDRQRVPFYLPVTLHCLARKKATAKILQSVTAMSIVMFRKAIYQLGLDEISMMQGQAPQRLSGQNDDLGPYNCPFQFQMKTAVGWFWQPGEIRESDIEITFQGALEEITYDSNGNPNLPPEEIITNKIKINQN